METAEREIQEETGISDLKLIKELGRYQRPQLNDPAILKTIHMFLFETDQQNLFSADKNTYEVSWVDEGEVTDTLFAEEDRDFFNKNYPKA